MAVPHEAHEVGPRSLRIVAGYLRYSREVWGVWGVWEVSQWQALPLEVWEGP